MTMVTALLPAHLESRVGLSCALPQVGDDETVFLEFLELAHELGACGYIAEDLQSRREYLQTLTSS